MIQSYGLISVYVHKYTVNHQLNTFNNLTQDRETRRRTRRYNDKKYED